MPEQTITKLKFSSIIAVVTLIVSIIAVIPAFLSLNTKKPDVYWSRELRNYKAPEGIKEALFDDFLKKNNIPPFSYSLILKNVGNAPSKIVKFSITLDGHIVRYAFYPSKIENPIWVDVPPNKEFGFNSNLSDIVNSAKNFAPNRLLIFRLDYDSLSSDFPETEVFFDGIESKYIKDINSLSAWNPYKIFYLPAYIFIGGILLTLLWILISIIITNPVYRSIFVDIGKAFVISTSDVFLNKQTSKATELIKLVKDLEISDKKGIDKDKGTD